MPPLFRRTACTFQRTRDTALVVALDKTNAWRLVVKIVYFGVPTSFYELCKAPRR